MELTHQGKVVTHFKRQKWSYIGLQSEGITHNKAEVKVDWLQHNRGMHIIQNPFEVNLSIVGFKIRLTINEVITTLYKLQTIGIEQDAGRVFMLFLQDVSLV
jgi:hypothetical protein